MIKSLKNKYSSFFYLILFLLITSSCDDNISDFGLDIIPPQDKYSVFELDTVKVLANQYFYDDTIYSENYPIVGIATDPVLGRVEASLLNDLYFDYSAITNYDNKKKTVDSVKIYLWLDTIYYKNTSNPLNNNLKFAIYSLTKPIDRKVTYKSSYDISNFTSGGQKLLEKEVNVLYKSITLTFPSSANSFFQKYIDLDSAQLIDDTTRYKYGIYGLYFKPIEVKENGIIVRFNTAQTSNTYIRIYFHVEDSTNVINDSISGYIFARWTNLAGYRLYSNASLNYIKFDHSKSSVSTVLNGNVNDSLLYFMGESGLYAKLDFSNLHQYSNNSNICVVKADLVIPYDLKYYNNQNNIYTLTDKISTFSLKLIQDDKLVSYSSKYGSMIYTAYRDTSLKSYVFDVTAFVQKVFLNATGENELYLTPTYMHHLKSMFFDKNKIKLKIKYTYFK